MQIDSIIVDSTSYTMLEDINDETTTYQVTETSTVIGYAKSSTIGVGDVICAYFDTGGQCPKLPIFMTRHSTVKHENEVVAHLFNIRTILGMQEARVIRDLLDTSGPDLFLPYCEECGGSDIKADATACWDREKQEWHCDVHRSYFCNTCHNSTIGTDRFIQ